MTKTVICTCKLNAIKDHIDHIAKVAGFDYVGLGGDYNGVSM